jgi:hypothetical protein
MDTNNLKSYQKEVFKEFEELSIKIDALITFRNTDEYFLNLKDIHDEYIKMLKKESIDGADSLSVEELRHMDELSRKSREYMLVCSQIDIMYDYRETLINRIVTWGIDKEDFLEY